jgi:hypothetical protein
MRSQGSVSIRDLGLTALDKAIRKEYTEGNRLQYKDCPQSIVTSDVEARASTPADMAVTLL